MLLLLVLVNYKSEFINYMNYFSKIWLKKYLTGI